MRLWIHAFGMPLVSLPYSAMPAGLDYPQKPIRLVTSSVGSATDFSTRLILPGLIADLGQPLVVDNRPGGLIQGEIVSRAQPDGYTLLTAGSVFIWGPLFTKTPYDPIRDFSTIWILGRSPNIVIVHPSVAAGSIKELIAFAKAKGGALNYASGPSGSLNHLAADLFKQMADVSVTRVAYKGCNPALQPGCRVCHRPGRRKRKVFEHGRGTYQQHAAVPCCRVKIGNCQDRQVDQRHWYASRIGRGAERSHPCFRSPASA